MTANNIEIVCRSGHGRKPESKIATYKCEDDGHWYLLAAIPGNWTRTVDHRIEQATNVEIGTLARLEHLGMSDDVYQWRKEMETHLILTNAEKAGRRHGQPIGGNYDDGYAGEARQPSARDRLACELCGFTLPATRAKLDRALTAVHRAGRRSVTLQELAAVIRGFTARR